MRKSSGVKNSACTIAVHVQASPPQESQTYFYYHKVGHVIADCTMLKAKGDHQYLAQPDKARLSLLKMSLPEAKNRHTK